MWAGVQAGSTTKRPLGPAPRRRGRTRPGPCPLCRCRGGRRAGTTTLGMGRTADLGRSPSRPKPGRRGLARARAGGCGGHCRACGDGSGARCRLMMMLLIQSRIPGPQKGVVKIRVSEASRLAPLCVSWALQPHQKHRTACAPLDLPAGRAMREDCCIALSATRGTGGSRGDLDDDLTRSLHSTFPCCCCRPSMASRHFHRQGGNSRSCTVATRTPCPLSVDRRGMSAKSRALSLSRMPSPCSEKTG